MDRNFQIASLIFPSFQQETVLYQEPMSNFLSWRRLAIKAIDLGRRTRMAKYLPELENSQWQPTQTLAEIQITRLQQILTFASQNVPFYIRLFAQNKWHMKDFRTLADLERLPVITKEMLRTAPFDFRPQGPRLWLSHKSRQTGGSTGEPLAYRVANDALE